MWDRGGWPGSERKAQTAKFTALIVPGCLSTRDGHMSVQVMYRNPPVGTNAAPVQYGQGGYEASFGTYEIDERAHSFTYHASKITVPGARYREHIEAMSNR